MTYYIIEETERLTKSINPSDNTVYAECNGRYRTTITRTNKAEANKIAKDCGMKVAIYTE